MIPKKSDPVWRKLVMSKTKPQFQNLGLRLLLTAMEMKLKRDPSEANIASVIDEIHGFCTKFDGTMDQDLQKIMNG